MEVELKRDIGAEIIMKIKDLEFKLSQLKKIKNEKELANTFVIRERSQG